MDDAYTSSQFYDAQEKKNFESRRRGTLDIIRGMLGAALDGARKTRIMYKADMNYSQLTRYIQQALDLELIRFDPSTSLYWTTEKGRRFLEAFSRYQQAEENLRTTRGALIQVLNEARLSPDRNDISPRKTTYW